MTRRFRRAWRRFWVGTVLGHGAMCWGRKPDDQCESWDPVFQMCERRAAVEVEFTLPTMRVV